MSFSYDLYILCDKCGDSLGDSAAFRRKQLPSEKSLADSLKKDGWKVIKDKELGWKTYCPKCKEEMKREKGK